MRQRRYRVDPIDNLGTVEGLIRDRTWSVTDTETGGCVSEHDRRADARAEAARLNAQQEGSK